jgi:hypothetical protein
MAVDPRRQLPELGNCWRPVFRTLWHEPANYCDSYMSVTEVPNQVATACSSDFVSNTMSSR